MPCTMTLFFYLLLVGSSFLGFVTTTIIVMASRVMSGIVQTPIKPRCVSLYEDYTQHFQSYGGSFLAFRSFVKLVRATS